jgi:phenylacetate-coenzyme A ligase PaaK-like adenylate-forming protein
MAASNQAGLLARQRADVSDGLFFAVRRLRWSADRLEADRERRLRELLAWSAARSPFHSERLVNVDISRFTEADLPSLPIMTRPI